MRTGDHWDPSVETLPREQLEKLQGARLARQVSWVAANSPFFSNLYETHDVHADDIRGLADLGKLPTMTKDDLRAWRESTGDPFAGGLCVPQRLLTRTNHSTGTSGLPNIYGLTRRDYDDVADQFARILYRVGLRSGDNTNNWLESAMGWHGYFMTAEGARRLGATVFSMEMDNRSIGATTLQMLKGVDLNAIFVYHPEIEIAFLKKTGLVPKEVHPNLRFIYSAALTTPARRKLLEDAWGVPYFNMGASGDQYLPGSECAYCAPGMHMLEDRSIIEILDPDTQEPVPDGQPGEVTVTNLWAEATPYLRYRFEDIAVADRTPCACGSTHMRLVYRGRMAWSVLVEGRRIFSDDVENILWQFGETQFAQYQLVRYARQPQSRLVVRTTLHHELVDDEAEFKARLTARLQEQLGVPTEVQFVEPGDIGIGTVKFQRVLTETGEG